MKMFWGIQAEKGLYGKLLWSDFERLVLLMGECRFYRQKKAQVIMLGLFKIWLSNLGSNQGPAD